MKNSVDEQMATQKSNSEWWLLTMHKYADKGVLLLGQSENPWTNTKPKVKFKLE